MAKLQQVHRRWFLLGIVGVLLVAAAIYLCTNGGKTGRSPLQSSNIMGEESEVMPPGDKPWSDTGEYNEKAFALKPRVLEAAFARLSPLKIKPGMVVADVGAGPGGLSWSVSKVVGASGIVLAIDINPIAIKLMRSRLREDPPAHNNIKSIHSHPWNVGISRTPYHGRVDRAFLMEVHFFRHWPDTAETASCLRSLFLAMRPESLLMVVEQKVGSLEQITRPIERAGFVQVERYDEEDKRIAPSYQILYRRP